MTLFHFFDTSPLFFLIYLSLFFSSITGLLGSEGEEKRGREKSNNSNTDSRQSIASEKEVEEEEEKEEEEIEVEEEVEIELEVESDCESLSRDGRGTTEDSDGTFRSTSNHI